VSQPYIVPRVRAALCYWLDVVDGRIPISGYKKTAFISAAILDIHFFAAYVTSAFVALH